MVFDVIVVHSFSRFFRDQFQREVQLRTPRGDALTGAVLAEAAATAAASLVEINLAGRPGDSALDRAREARRKAGEARAEALGLVAT